MKQLQHHEVTNIKTTFPIIIICEHFRSPQNVGMAFRISEIMGVQHLYLLGDGPAPPLPKVRRTARQADQLVPFSIHKDGIACCQQLKKEAYTLIGIEITDQSKSLYNWQPLPNTKIALLFGAERGGISKELLPLLDDCYHIPMYGQISSMNVVTAISICLYEITKQWMTLRPPSKL